MRVLNRKAGAQRRRFTWNRLLWSLVYPQRRHRITFTVSGLLLTLLALALGTAAYNSANNILFIALSLLLACLILSGVLSWLNFSRVSWRLQAAPPWRAGMAGTAGIGLENRKRFLPTYGLWFEVALRPVESGPVGPASTVTASGRAVRAALARAKKGSGGHPVAPAHPVGSGRRGAGRVAAHAAPARALAGRAPGRGLAFPLWFHRQKFRHG